MKSSSSFAAPTAAAPMVGTTPKQPNLNELMLARSDWLAQQLASGVEMSRFNHITPAQTRLLAQMGGKPTSMAELARRLGVSRQAVHKTVNDLQNRGILQVEEDPERGNATKVAYTALGREVNREGAKIIQQIETRLEKQLGAKQVQQLKLLLQQKW